MFIYRKHFSSRHKKKIVILIFFLTLLSNLYAEDKKDREQKPYTSSTSLSFLLTSGNTQESTFGFDTEQNLNFEKNEIQFKGSIIYSRSKGEKKSEFFYGHLGHRYNLNAKIYLLGFGRTERNVLAGYNYRLALSAGAGYIWRESEKWGLLSEAALGLSAESNISIPSNLDGASEMNGLNKENITVSFASCLISSKLNIIISSNSEFTFQETFFLNLDKTKDYRLSSAASLSANISNHLALKLSYQLNYNHLPVPGFKSTDQYLLSSLVFNF